MCNTFYKFPSTPHVVLGGNISGVNIRNEKILDDDVKNYLFSHDIYIEEKIDGANLGISFNNNGNLLLQNRGSYIYEPFIGQWKELNNWISINQDSLFDILGNKYILFGEWCYAKHTIFYNSLPDWFLAFDIYDKTTFKFLSINFRDQLIDRMSLYKVPLLYYGHVNLNQIPKMIGKSKVGNDICEGLYFRYDKDDWLEIRAKYVKPSFIQSDDKHWSKKVLIPNQILNRYK